MDLGRAWPGPDPKLDNLCKMKFVLILHINCNEIILRCSHECMFKSKEVMWLRSPDPERYVQVVSS